MGAGVVGQQFFPRAGQILVGGKGCDQCANRHMTQNDQIAPDGKEKERRQLGQEVVEKLHEEFFAIDRQPDKKQNAQTVGDLR